MQVLLVTIPKSRDYNIILKEMEQCKEDEYIVLNHKLGKNKPKKQPKYINFIYNGEIRFAGDLIEYEHKDFNCTTTNEFWNKSWYAVFNNAFEIEKDKRIKFKGFQGFRYVEIDIKK